MLGSRSRHELRRERAQFGDPRLTKRRKARILCKTAARLCGISPRDKRCEIEGDQIAQMQQEAGGIAESRSHIVYGPRTEQSFRQLMAHGAGRNAHLT